MNPLFFFFNPIEWFRMVNYLLQWFFSIFETWTRQAYLKNKENETAVQGLAVGTNYCYSFGVTDKDAKHFLYRYDMKNGGNPKEMDDDASVKTLLHASDATLASYTDSNGVKHNLMYVDTWNDQGPTSYLVKLEYDSSGNYWEVARYKYNDVDVTNKAGAKVTKYGSVARVKDYTKDGHPWAQFLLRSNRDFFTAEVRLDETVVTTNGKKVGTMDNPYELKPACKFQVNYEDNDTYTGQGIDYVSDNGGELYVARWAWRKGLSDKKNENVILLYKGIDNAIANKPSKALDASKTWTIKNGDNPKIKFEIEGIGFPINSTDNKLWFNTNEADSADKKTNGGIYTDSKVTK